VKTFSVRCEPELAEIVAQRVAIAAQVEAAWKAWRRGELDATAETEGWSTSRLVDERRGLAAEEARLRATGVLRGTRGAWVLPALTAIFEERGWSARRFDPLPAGAGRGRPRGAGDAGYRAQVVLQLPDDVAKRLVRACWWTSEKAERRLQEWHELHGDNRRGERHGGRPANTPARADLAARARIAAQIVTTGDVLRQALRRAAATYSVGG
jgi:hypothetical protein